MLGRFAGRRQQQAGDTLIEVLFAVSVFSLVVVTSLALMNQGTAASVRSLQITVVRQEIDSQADALRFLNSSYVAAYKPDYVPVTASPAGQYNRITTDAKTARAGGKTSVSQFASGGTDCQTPPSGSFIINTKTGTYQRLTSANTGTADPLSQVEYDSAGALVRARGIWIESVRSVASGGTAYIDFHIRSCWHPPGVGQPLTLGTIVRLYEPAN